MTKRYRIAEEIKQQILRRVKDEGVPVAKAADEHGVSVKVIYNWLAKGVEGAPTLGELARVKRENRELLALVGELTLRLSATQKKN